MGPAGLEPARLAAGDFKSPASTIPPRARATSVCRKCSSLTIALDFFLALDKLISTPFRKEVLMAGEVFVTTIGGVLFDHVDPTSDRSLYGDGYLEMPEVPGAFDALAALVDRFGDRRYVFFKCRLEAEERTRDWLIRRRFFERTGIRNDHVAFYRKDRMRLLACKELHATHVVDRSMETLLMYRFVRCRILFRARPHEIKKYFFSLRRVHQVHEWSEIVTFLHETLPS